MNGPSCSTNIEVSRPQRTFFLKVGGLISVAGFVSILAFLALAGAGCQTDANTTTFSGQAEVPRHVILASGDVVKSTFSSAPELNQSQKVRADGKLARPWLAKWMLRARPLGNYRAS